MLLREVNRQGVEVYSLDQTDWWNFGIGGGGTFQKFFG